MSDTSQGPGWWLASDGRWYPPELWTGPAQTGPGAATPATPDQGAPGPAQSGIGDESTSHPVSAGADAGQRREVAGAGYRPQYNVPAPQRTNGLAVASLVCSCAGILVFGLPCILGIIFGFVARSQIRRSGGMQRGDGLALAGIIVGFAWVSLAIIVIIVAAANSSSSGVVALA